MTLLSNLKTDIEIPTPHKVTRWQLFCFSCLIHVHKVATAASLDWTFWSAVCPEQPKPQYAITTCPVLQLLNRSAVSGESKPLKERKPLKIYRKKLPHLCKVFFFFFFLFVTFRLGRNAPDIPDQSTDRARGREELRSRCLCAIGFCSHRCRSLQRTASPGYPLISWEHSHFEHGGRLHH